MDRGDHPSDVRHDALAQPGQLLQVQLAAGEIVIDEGAQTLQPDGTGHRRDPERQPGADPRREPGEHLQLRLQAHGRLLVAR